MALGRLGLAVGLVVGALGTAVLYETYLGGTNSAFGNMVREQVAKTGLAVTAPSTGLPPTPSTASPPAPSTGQAKTAPSNPVKTVP